MKPTVTLSVGAVLGGLGMGQGGYKIARVLRDGGAGLRVISVGAQPGLLSDVRLDFIPLNHLARIIHATPLRLWPGLVLATTNNYFDWRASQLLNGTDVFYGYSDQALLSIRAARSHGSITILHAANTHIEHLAAELRTEARLYGAIQNWISPLMIWKVGREYQEADYIRTQSTLVRDSLLARGIPAHKIVFIPPAVDLERFRPPRARDDVFRVAFVGSFDLRKGIQYLLRAWDDARLPRAELILHGGAGSRFAERMLRPYRDRPDVVFRAGDPAPTYADASVCVVPSIEDGFAYVVLEALASGCPVIVSDQVGGKDAVVDGENGFIVPARDAAAIRDRLVALRAAPRERARMAAAARDSAERFSFQAEAARWQATLARLVEQHAP
jgi:glycosyltransferase involved in cell wall biosynthesis